MFGGLFLQDFTSCSGGRRQESVCIAGIEEEPHDGAGLEPGGTVPHSTQPGKSKEKGDCIYGVCRAGHFTRLFQRKCILRFLHNSEHLKFWRSGSQMCVE